MTKKFEVHFSDNTTAIFYGQNKRCLEDTLANTLYWRKNHPKWTFIEKIVDLGEVKKGENYE